MFCAVTLAAAITIDAREQPGSSTEPLILHARVRESAAPAKDSTSKNS